MSEASWRSHWWLLIVLCVDLFESSFRTCVSSGNLVSFGYAIILELSLQLNVWAVSTHINSHFQYIIRAITMQHVFSFSRKKACVNFGRRTWKICLRESWTVNSEVDGGHYTEKIILIQVFSEGNWMVCDFGTLAKVLSALLCTRGASRVSRTVPDWISCQCIQGPSIAYGPRVSYVDAQRGTIIPGE